MTELRRTALFEVHRRSGARMTDFGGWEMPIEYSTGVLAEHEAVREDVGVFDVSHMGKLVVGGSGADAALNRLLVNDIDRITAGRAQYSMLCNESGGVVDDLLVYRLATDRVLVIPNAANAGTVRAELRSALPPDVGIIDRHEADGILAIQGPRSRSLMVELGLLPPETDLEYMALRAAVFDGGPALVFRTGYTGEHGYEVLIGAQSLPDLWEAVAARATPCGLAARDTLRTEMGYPLHGQDLSPSITPLEAGMAWVVGWDKPAFRGRDALLAQRRAGSARRLRGLLVEGRGIPRPGMGVRDPQGRVVGETTSGTWSPTRKAGIALALLESAVEPGDPVAIDIRGRQAPARVVAPPFVDRSPR